MNIRSAALISAVTVTGSLAANAALTTGFDPAANHYGGVRYRSFANTGSQEAFLGTDISSPGTYMVNQQFSWIRPGNNTFSLIYDPVNNELRTQVNNNPVLVFSASTAQTSASGTPSGPPGPGFTPNDVNYLRMRIQEGNSGSTVTVNNLTITPLGNGALALGTSYSSPGPESSPNFADWYLADNALKNGFTLTGVISLTGAFSSSQEASKIDFYLGNSATAAVPEPSTYIAGALLLIPFAGGAIRSLRTRKQS